MTTITLPEDIEAWARQEVSAGRATSVEDFVAASLRERRAMIDSHRALVTEAYEEIGRGESVDGGVVDAMIDRWIAEDSGSKAP